MLAQFAALLLAASAPPCPPLPGVEAIWSRPQVRVLIFGESRHGSTQAPALFADAVCHAAARGPVVVALEVEAASQSALDTFMASDGSPSAVAALRAVHPWSATGAGEDGRGSQATLLLMQSLRRLAAAGRKLQVVAAVPNIAPSRSQTYWEIDRAAAFAHAIPDEPQSLLMVLVGNFHASKASMGGLMPAAAHLPANEVLSLNVVGAGGEVWGCSPSSCGLQTFAEQDSRARGIYLELSAGYDGVATTGGRWTASLPASQAAH